MTPSGAEPPRRSAPRSMWAVGVLALWLAGLALLARREFFRPHVDRLADAALRVNQATTFFAVSRDSGLVGYASSVIDTTTSSIIITNYLVTEISGPRPRSTSRAKITLSRTLKLREFQSSVLSNSVDLRVSGKMAGDTALTYSVATEGRPPVTRSIKTDGIVLLPQLIPLAIALTTKPEVGKDYAFPVFDPSLQEVVQVRSTIRAESLFVISDSAVLDSATRLWRGVRSDTVRAWKIESTAGGFNGWLDEAGHVVKTVDLGSKIDRMTYEESFRNWVLLTTDRRLRALPPSLRPPGWTPLPAPQTGGRPPSP